MIDINFVSYDENKMFPLGKQNVRDIIDVLYRGDKGFSVHGIMHESRRTVRTLGLHMFDIISDTHEVFLSPDSIRTVWSDGRPVGGNIIAPNIAVAFGMVLAHEIQHANQTLFHSTRHKSFYGGKYAGRACEREARMFADDNIQIISEILGTGVLLR